LYQKLRKEWWNEFKINKYGKKYFYNLNIYKKIKYILKTELKQNDYKDIIIPNDKEIYYLHEKNICFNKILIPFYKINNNYKLKILYFIFINLKI